MLGRGATTILEDVCNSPPTIVIPFHTTHPQEKYHERLQEFPTLSILVLSDLWLDHPQTFKGLRQVLDGCVENNFIPFVFVFCGNFSQRGMGLTDAGIARYQGQPLAGTFFDQSGLIVSRMAG
jgi:hypothetical protein